jgi:hypothetical protein
MHRQNLAAWLNRIGPICVRGINIQCGTLSKKCYLTKLWTVSCVLQVSFSTTLCNSIGEFKVKHAWWKERIVSPVRHSLFLCFVHFTHPSSHDAKHNFSGFHPRPRQSSSPLSHPQPPTAPASLRAGSLLELCTKCCLPHWRASVSCRRPTTGDATRHVSPPFSTCFSSQRSISRLSFIFAESDTDWCDPLAEICLKSLLLPSLTWRSV